MSFLKERHIHVHQNKRAAVRFMLLLASGFLLLSSTQAHAFLCACKPGDCATGDCNAGINSVRAFHNRLRQNTKQEFDDDLAAYQEWLVEDFYNGQVGPAMQSMSSQMAAVAMHYVQTIGMFLDAQTQMDTQRIFRELQHEAHKDYVPSEDFCWFGSNVKSLASSQSKSKFNALALSQFALTRQTGVTGTTSAESALEDYQARWGQFVTTHCNPRDNNFQGSSNSGLYMACDHDGLGGASNSGAVNRDRYNIDINYTRLIEDPKTLEIDFTNNDLDITRIPENTIYSATGPIYEPRHEEDVIAMASNLYGHNPPSRTLTKKALTEATGQDPWFFRAYKRLFI